MRYVFITLEWCTQSASNLHYVAGDVDSTREQTIRFELLDITVGVTADIDLGQ